MSRLCSYKAKTFRQNLKYIVHKKSGVKENDQCSAMQTRENILSLIEFNGAVPAATTTAMTY